MVYLVNGFYVAMAAMRRMYWLLRSEAKCRVRVYHLRIPKVGQAASAAHFVPAA